MAVILLALFPIFCLAEIKKISESMEKLIYDNIE
jgi:hypothetical protein